MPQTFLSQLEAHIRTAYAEQGGLADELLSGSPVTEAEIAAAEQLLGTTFPSLYRALLLRFGGGCDLGIEIDSLPQVIENTQWLRQYFADSPSLPEGLLQQGIAFAGDGSGNYFVLHNGAVWLPDHDSGACTREAESLEAFLRHASSAA
ncbi:SMI1/KNR4 family protein [Eikenella sp. S3360]|uniref:SMI1/KNR4 family protein n=1 Tax=Eikenella glucosivorans TaxID=2766967 RepID=A0ABS0N953_9NEIS|nr:SMI1/KNR4 family protein [Eikenella glucosivorans]MBH5328837.1 SMI1/KNR4 family protein [Eikenella glucosivorans]